MSKRWFLAHAAAMLLFVSADSALAEDMSAPAIVQGRFLARLLPYERGFAARTQNDVVIVLVEKSGDADSSSSVSQMRSVLQDIGSIEGHPIRVETVIYTDPASIALGCKNKGADVVYVSPGLHDIVTPLAEALTGSGVLSFAGVAGYVPPGMVVGIDIIAGKPKMSINITRARAQRIELPASVLALATVYE